MQRPANQSPPTPEVHNLRTLKRLLGRFRTVWAASAVLALLLLLRSGLEIAYPFLVGTVMDRLVGYEGSGGSLPDGYVTLIGLLTAVIVVRAITFYLSGVQAARIGQAVENGLRSELFEKVARLRFRYHDANRSGATIVRSLRDMEKTRHFFREVFFGYVEILLLVAAVLLASFWMHWAYGVVVLLTFGLGIAACILAARKVAQMDREVSEIYDGVTTVLQENVAGARVVRSFGREPNEVRKFGTHMDDLTQSWARLERFWTGLLPIVHHLFALSVPLIVAVGAWRVSQGSGGIGEVTTVLLYCRTVHHRIRPLTRLVIVGQQATASASRVFEVLDETNVIPTPAVPRVLPAHGGAVRFEDVYFAYRPDVPVLQGVTLDIPVGESLGIIGPTGAGKSTLVQLLPRFYDPDRGRVLLDGIDLNDLDVHALRSAVGLVFQEAFLFSGTVAENVAYGRPEISLERVEECVRLAAAEEFVRELPQGYDTMVGERGVSLSGGQRQRLTIARALAMDPRVLIFDDATASVDAVTEKQLFEGIRAAARGRTTLVISQRVTSVRWCDRIAVLDDGRITAVGSHAELLERSPLYREIDSHQQLTGTMP